MKQLKKFELGDLVSWESQSQGWTTVKCGTIVQIVKQGIKPNFIPFHGTHSVLYGGGFGRNHESYLIEVPHPGKGKPRIYWPNANNLQKEKV